MQPVSDKTGKEPLKGLLNEVDDGCSLFEAPAPIVSSNASRLFADLSGDEEFIPSEECARPSKQASCTKRTSGGGSASSCEEVVALEDGFGYPSAPKKGAGLKILSMMTMREASEYDDHEIEDPAADEWVAMQNESWRPVMPAWHRDPSESEMHTGFVGKATREATTFQRPSQIEQSSESEDEEIDWAATLLPADQRISIGFKDMDQWSDHDGEASTCSMGNRWDDNEGSDFDAEMLESELHIGYRADVGCGDGFPDDDQSEAPSDKLTPQECDSQLAEGVEETEEGPPPPPLVPPPPPKIDHVFLLVHGIGATEEGLAESIRNVKDTFEAVKKHWFWHVEMNVHVEMVEWKCSVIEQQAHIFEKITPNDVARETRMTLNATLSDVIFYKTPHHRQLILETVISKMNACIEELHNDPDGRFADSQISVIGHSLGSVILYDILTGWNASDATMTPDLNFKVDNFFLWGSPVAALVSIADFDTCQGQFNLPADMGVYNIFHPHDPIAFRIEPLVYHNQDIAPPETLPYWENNGVRDDKKWVRRYEYAKGIAMERWDEFTKNFREVLSSGRESAHELARKFHAEQALRFTLSGSSSTGQQVAQGVEDEERDEEKTVTVPPLRLDFAVQEHAAEAIVEQYGMLQSHSCYWTSKDVMLFMLKKITNHELSPYPANSDSSSIGGNTVQARMLARARMRQGDDHTQQLPSMFAFECLRRDRQQDED